MQLTLKGVWCIDPIYQKIYLPTRVIFKEHELPELKLQSSQPALSSPSSPSLNQDFVPIYTSSTCGKLACNSFFLPIPHISHTTNLIEFSTFSRASYITSILWLGSWNRVMAWLVGIFNSLIQIFPLCMVFHIEKDVIIILINVDDIPLVGNNTVLILSVITRLDTKFALKEWVELLSGSWGD